MRGVTKVNNDSLWRIFDLQKQLDERIINTQPFMEFSRDKMISGLCTAIIHEAVELQRLTNWKWWKKPTQFDEKAAREELIDIWHFVISLSIKLGMKPEDIIAEYERKNKINHERQEIGY